MRIEKFCALLLVAASAGAEMPDFPPVHQWADAVRMGNGTAITKFYRNGARVSVDRQPEPLEVETAFWSGFTAQDLGDFDAKILSIQDAGSQVTVVLRVQGTLQSRKFAMSMVQLWSNDGGGWRIAAVNRSQPALDRGRRLPEPARPNPNLYPPVAEARAELHDAIKRAAAGHKRVLVVFGANWCYDCHVLDTTFRSARFAPVVRDGFVVVHINTGDEGKDNNDLAAELRVNLDRGIPALAVLDERGKVLVGQQNGEFESTTRIGPEDVWAFLQKWKE